MTPPLSIMKFQLISIVRAFFDSGIILSREIFNRPSFNSAPFTSVSSEIVNDLLKYLWDIPLCKTLPSESFCSACLLFPSFSNFERAPEKFSEPRKLRKANSAGVQAPREHERALTLMKHGRTPLTRADSAGPSAGWFGTRFPSPGRQTQPPF